MLPGNRTCVMAVTAVRSSDREQNLAVGATYLGRYRMRETTGHSRRVSNKLKAAFAALLAIVAVSAVAASGAQAAQGDPFEADFNHVGLNVAVSLSPDPIDSLVLTPDTLNPETSLPLGELEMNGTYTDNAGNFTLPTNNGLEFPKVLVDLDIVQIEGEIALTEPAKGNYNAATGQMSVDPKISLTLGTDAMENLPEPANAFGEGPLRCKLAPLDLKLSTENGWPHDGYRFADPATLTGGALAGSWNVKPGVEAVEGPEAACDLIAGFLDPVGGIWMAQSDTTLTSMPAPTASRPVARPCPAGTTGEPGVPLDECKPVPVKCDPPQTGTKPNCKDPIVEEPKSAEITKVAITPAKGSIKAGKSLKVKVKVTNTGNEASGAIKVSLKSTNKKVTLPKSISVNVAAGATVTKSVTVKASKKAKGKATLTAKYGSKSGKSVLTVKKAKKKK